MEVGRCKVMLVCASTEEVGTNLRTPSHTYRALETLPSEKEKGKE